jgi:23S rRNA maturation-related 3'-5' exoribonuclease YhaM
MKITKQQLKEIIKEELNELDVPHASVEDQMYAYAKNMFNTKLHRILDELIEKSRGKVDKNMKMRILQDVARALGDRQ